MSFSSLIVRKRIAYTLLQCPHLLGLLLVVGKAMDNLKKRALSQRMKTDG
jgi:hypothetical protein